MSARRLLALAAITVAVSLTFVGPAAAVKLRSCPEVPLPSRLIDAKKAQHSVSLLCEVLGVSRCVNSAEHHTRRPVERP